MSTYASATYAEARGKFLEVAKKITLGAGDGTASIQSYLHPTQKGALGEDLATDVALIGPAQAKRLIIVSSAMHGAEGFCGSLCQIGLMHDSDILARLEKAGIAMLLIHAINPYGFSHLRRVNEDNVDLNRNFLNFDEALPVNPEYANVHDLMLPEQWPPTELNMQQTQAYIAQHGMRKFQFAVSTGQSTHPNGVFFSGRKPTWSNQTLRQILRDYAQQAKHIAWMDIHTGLGPSGHGEKIHAGRDDAQEVLRGRACWGADVVSPFDGSSQSEAVRGYGCLSVFEECPQADSIAISLEYGTQDFLQVMQALRADHWLANHPEASELQRASIKRQLRDAFYVDTPEWRGMVYAQTRVAVLQALMAFQDSTGMPSVR